LKDRAGKFNMQYAIFNKKLFISGFDFTIFLYVILGILGFCFFLWVLYQCCKLAEDTGKSFSEALILASSNPQYDKRLFIELPF
jgi:hypothetical protein